MNITVDLLTPAHSITVMYAPTPIFVDHVQLTSFYRLIQSHLNLSVNMWSVTYKIASSAIEITSVINARMDIIQQHQEDALNYKPLALSRTVSPVRHRIKMYVSFAISDIMFQKLIQTVYKYLSLIKHLNI